MGEIFRQIRPVSSFPFTGERMVPGQTGAIEAEHLHRYFLARALCHGKDVLDIASGEGYGAAFLAQTSRTVIGVELDAASVEYARSIYHAANLKFVVGDAVRIPIGDHSVNIVVSFETIEHIADHEQFFYEVKRVLRPNGLLLISTPDKSVYSALGTASNPFHVRELTETEFRKTLSAAFHNVAIFRQRAFSGSAIVPDAIADGQNKMMVFERRDSQAFEADTNLSRAPYLVAIACDEALPEMGVSLYLHGDCGTAAPEIMSELQRLRNVESKFREQQPVTAKALIDAATIPALQLELDRLRKLEDMVRQQAPTVAQAMSDAAAVPALQAELERLRKIEDMAREQAASAARLSADAASARAETEGYRRAGDRLQAEFDQVQVELRSNRAQLNSALSMARQQSLTSQRSLTEMLALRQELRATQQAYQEALGLLVPWRLRRAVPESWKPPLRRIKRALRWLGYKTS